MLRSLQWRIALAYTALIFITMGLVSIYLISFIRDTYRTDAEARLEAEAKALVAQVGPLMASGASREDLETALQEAVAGRGLGATLLDPAGNVLLRVGSGNPGPDVAEGPVAVAPILDGGVLLGTLQVDGGAQAIRSNMARIVVTIVVAALVVAFLSLGLGYVLARQTSRSLQVLTEGARRIARGELTHRVQAPNDEETRELAQALNSMAEALQKMLRDLSEERNKLSAVLTTMGDGVLVLGPDGRLELVNPAAEELLDLRLEEATGRRFVEAVRDHELQSLVAACMETGQPQYGEVKLVHARRYLSAVATPLADEGQWGVLLTLHDLTRSRQVETTRREFVSNVSHELRSPLASVKAMVETLEEGAIEDTAVARDFLRRMHRDVDRMVRMVNELLDLSRLESGQVSLSLEPLDLAAAAKEALQGFQERAQEKGIRLEVDLPADLPKALGEEEGVRRILINLLDNALKFTPRGGQVRVSARAVDGVVEVTVSDTGVGIAPEHLPHVFERFYKVDRSRRDGGTGLGLAIVKHLVQAQGGRVAVHSRQGAGSTFVFSLPQAEAKT